MPTAPFPTFLQFGSHGECLLNTTQIRAVTRDTLPVTAANREALKGHISPEGVVYLVEIEFLDGEHLTMKCASVQAQQQLILQMSKAMQAHLIPGSEAL
ncbi:hypothetical protein [Hymenobacter crusticola]|uniref:Uncharacterized protein n=1 Tax=Hymenobacter crusticola TaxID=1770526 RepID=A0A243W5E0_9BACT|nr:hypothetical protein [Hymenobacter crusticola]OUJ67779.1 hypothetical protein BXP70_28525 [Hymenobacter crusticola]